MAIARVCPEVVGSLKSEVFQGSLPLAEWAGRYHLSGTWLEREAIATLRLWSSQPELTEAPGWSLPAIVRSSHEDQTRSFHMTIAIPPDLRFERPWFEWSRTADYIRTEIRRMLDDELQRYKNRHMKVTQARQIVLPSDFELKMEVCALYLCRGWSASRIGELAPYARSRTRIFHWVQEIGRLLQLNVSKRAKPRTPR